MLTPIIGAPEGTPEYRYTQTHVRVRNTVERCIGLLKEIFRCIHSERILHYKPNKVANIIYASAILYNYRLERNILPEDIDFILEGKSNNK